MHLSRRELLASSAALLAAPISQTGIICSLEESRIAFSGLKPFAGVLVESGVGFAHKDLSWLQLHGISLDAPRDVRGPQWIRYSWPFPAMIRDFGRICPVRGGTVIARLDDTPAAVRKGRLIVLGSPLGPHIYAGDREACSLFDAFF